MLLSLNTLKKFIDFNYSPEELDRVLTTLGIEVESVVDYGKKFRNFKVAEVLEKEKHPDADKLSVCQTFDGTETRTVVCGASNVAAGLKIVLATPGAVVPNGGFTIEKRKVRKVESNGMICSKSELEISDDSDGIWILPDDAPVGADFADYAGLNDVVFEISMTPNRPDCLNYLGIARELSAYSGLPYRKPAFTLNETGADINASASVEILDEDKCPRYSARLIRGVKIKESPDWLKNVITASGMRPKNAAVDVTNFVMLECGQPLHAFDFSRLEGSKIVVRTAGDGEKFTTLDGKERILESEALMICDASRPVAIGGVMGGQNSEIEDDTRDILIESAYFKPASVRRTAKKLGIQSESSYRFERGVDPGDNIAWALDRAAYLINDICGGELASGAIDVNLLPTEKKIVRMNFDRARRIIGANLADDYMTELLVKLGFELVDKTNTDAAFIAPTHRVDVFDEIDLIEEVVRLNDYDNLEPRYETTVTIEGSAALPELTRPALRNRIRDFFVNRGFNETLTQNMLDPASASMFTDSPVKIANPLGEELSIMRPSMVPATLKTIAHNKRNGSPDIRIFEIGKIFRPSRENEKVFIAGIKEQETLTVALSGADAPKQWAVASRPFDFYDIKGIAELFVKAFKFEKIDFSENKNLSIFSKNSLSITTRGVQIGVFGEIGKPVLKKFDIESPVFILEIDLSALYGIKVKEAKYSKLSPYPTSERDLAFLCDSSKAAGDFIPVIRKAAGQLLKDVTLFDVYEGKNLGEGKKSLAFSLLYSSDERTLTEAELEESTAAVVREVEAKFGAELRKF